MACASILTLEPSRGGVPALARVVYEVLAARGHLPRLLYQATADVPAGSRSRALRHFLTSRPLRRLVRGGMSCIAVTSYPVPARYQYHLPRLARAAVRAPLAAVVSGSSHVGLARALTGRPYVLWVATLYGDEILGRSRAGDPWAQQLLGSRDWFALETQERLVYERAGAILTASPYTQERVAGRWPDLAHRVRTVLHPIDTERFEPGPAPADPPYLLLTARIEDPRKNVGALLRAFAQVRIRHPRLRLVIAGGQPTEGSRELAARLALGDAVTFAGYVPDSELPALYRRASAFILPSLQEGLGISVQEAMASGLPVVATRCGGPECLVEHGRTGCLVARDDPSALAQSIADLLSDPGRMRSMGKAGRDHAVRFFSRPGIEEALRAAFREAHGAAF